MRPSKAARFILTLALSGLAAVPCVGEPKAEYVDPALCASCHGDIARDFAQTGMGKSFRSIRSNGDLPEFDGKTLRATMPQSSISPHFGATVSITCGATRSAFDGSVTNVVEKEVQYIFGSEIMRAAICPGNPAAN